MMFEDVSKAQPVQMHIDLTVNVVLRKLMMAFSASHDDGDDDNDGNNLRAATGDL